MSDRICIFPDCGKPDRSRGLCQGHAEQRRKGQELRPLRAYPARQKVVSGVSCAVESCGRQARRRGFCESHYVANRDGRPFNRFDLTPSEWFYARVIEDLDTGCWLWTGDTSKHGYGRVREGRSFVYAHRWSYEYMRAEIPDGLVIDHLCRVHNCVNPDHLEPVPELLNWARGLAPSAINRRKTHCKHGHEFTPANTIRRKSGGRRCRACMNAYNASTSARRAVR